MRHSLQLREALARFAAAEKAIEAIGTRTDKERKQALVHSRRQLSEQIGVLGPIIDQDTGLAQHPEMHRELGKRFSAMRYGLAHHQASWPAVTIDDDPIAYRASALNVQEKALLFWQYCGQHIGIHRT